MPGNTAVFSWDSWNLHLSGNSPKLLFFAGTLVSRENLISQLGLQDKDSSVEALLAAAYRTYGENCPNYIFGDFAFALAIPGRREIFTARDVAGCQPVYFHNNSNRFAISDSIEGLLSVEGVSKELDEPFIASALTSFYSHPERTFLNDVRKIPPAHAISFTPFSRQLQQYWRAEDIERYERRTDTEAQEEFRGLVRQAIRDRLPEHGGLGVHLSGGLDCSTIAVLASQELRKKGKPAPIGFTWHPPASEVSNSDYQSLYRQIESVSKQEGIEQIYCPPTKSDCLRVIQRDTATLPICGCSYNESPVQREAAARGVTVMMSGFGGDETASFNGRGYLNRLALSGEWIKLYNEAKLRGRNPAKFLAARLGQGFFHKFAPNQLLKRYTRDSFDIPLWKILARAAVSSSEGSSFLLTANEYQAIAHQVSYLNKDFVRKVKKLPGWNPIRLTSAHQAQCDFLQQGHIVNRIESWAAEGASQGIRYVYPLLDRRVLECVLSQPEKSFSNHKYSRLFIRQAMDSIIPDEVCWSRDNTELPRAYHTGDVFMETLKDVGKILSHDRAKISRASYVDISRLINDLTKQSLDKRKGFARLFFALQFLDLG